MGEARVAKHGHQDVAEYERDYDEKYGRLRHFVELEAQFEENDGEGDVESHGGAVLHADVLGELLCVFLYVVVAFMGRVKSTKRHHSDQNTVPHAVYDPAPEVVQPVQLPLLVELQSLSVLDWIHHLEWLVEVSVLQGKGNEGLQRAQDQVVGRDKDTDVVLLSGEAAHELESDLRANQDHILVDVEVDQFANLLMAVEAVSEQEFLDLEEVGDDDVSISLHRLSDHFHLGAWYLRVLRLILAVLGRTRICPDAEANVGCLQHQCVVVAITDSEHFVIQEPLCHLNDLHFL